MAGALEDAVIDPVPPLVLCEELVDELCEVEVLVVAPCGIAAAIESDATRANSEALGAILGTGECF